MTDGVFLMSWLNKANVQASLHISQIYFPIKSQLTVTD